MRIAKKRFLSLGLGLILSLSSAMVAFADITQVTLTASQHSNSSTPIWGNEGDIVFYDFQSNSSSVHHVGFGVYYEPFPYSGLATLVDRSVVAPGGTMYDSFSAPNDGYYYLEAKCGGNGQTGCSGNGILDTNW